MLTDGSDPDGVMASMKYLSDHLRAYNLVELFFLEAPVEFYHLSKVSTPDGPVTPVRFPFGVGSLRNRLS